MASSSRPARDGNGGRTHAVIGAAGALMGTVALCAGPFVSFRPNRVVEGDTASAVQALGPWVWPAIALWLSVGILAALPLATGRRWARVSIIGTESRPKAVLGCVRVLLAGAALSSLLVGVGRAASDFTSGQGAVARTSFGWCFYLFVFALYLVLHSATGDIASRPLKIAICVLPLVAVALPVGAGLLGDVGFMREWSLTQSTFARELTRHLFYALGATVGAIVIGIPLGIVSARHRRAETIIMGTLNLGQVLPVLAFVGIMIPIMSGLSNSLSLLKSLGVSGIGWAPVMVVLLVYALFPVTRNTLVAIRQLDPAVLDTAKGMGMGRWRSLREVELPLAFPVVLAGIRIALVQSTAGAIIAAFVGGGGLGTIMFLGLEQTSMDLVLVGVVPIVALALFFDAILRGVEYVTSARRRTEPVLETA